MDTVQSSRPVRRRGLLTLSALLSSGLLLAGACSSSETTSTDGPADEIELETGAQPPVTLAADGAPQYGGTLTYALEAETTGFKPTVDRWSIVGVMMGLAVYDPLVATNADGEPSPYLAESFEPSDDYTTWTFTLRDGVTFHDGTPLTAEAVAKVYDLHLVSPLTGAAIANVESVTATGPLTVEFEMKSPWVMFPAALTGQLGVIPSPDTLDSEDGANNPVGTGPFELVEWVPDARFQAKRYESYWRTDTDGNQLPYLDGVVFRPTPENQQRLNSLKTGDVDMFHTTETEIIRPMREMAANGEIQLVEDRGETEETFVMLNTSEPPFDDIRARRALALATDPVDYVAVITGDVNAPAFGVFAPNSPWYLEDNGYPAYDPEEARRLVEEIKADRGEFRFVLRGAGPDTAKNIEYLQQQWAQVGIDAQVNTEQQNSFITDAVGGNYQANFWRQFGAPDPDTDYLWWISDNAEGPLALNIARNANPEIDAALDKGRQSDDRATRLEAYHELQRLMSQDVPYIWLAHTTWAIAANNNVRGITNGPLPNGEAAYPVGGSGFPGVTFLTQTWKTG